MKSDAASSASSRMPASMRFRDRMISTARSDSVTGADPEGPPRHFCRPAVAASSPHPSASNGLPPSDAVASV